MASGGQDPGILAPHFLCPASKLDPLRPDHVLIRGVEVRGQLLAALRRKSEGGAVMWVAGDGLLKQRQRLPYLPGREQRISTQIEVVGAEITCAAASRAGGLGRPQCRLDDPCDARRHLVLQIENIF